MTSSAEEPRIKPVRRIRKVLAFLGMAFILALLGHVGFVAMTGGSVVEAFEGKALLFFALPALLVPAAVALAIALGPQLWQRTRTALIILAVATALHALVVSIWIAGISHATSQAYAVMFLAPALLGAIVAAIALALVRPFRA